MCHAAEDGFTALATSAQEGKLAVVEPSRPPALPPSAPLPLSHSHPRFHSDVTVPRVRLPCAPVQVRCLLASGAAVNHADQAGFTALSLAAQDGHLDVVQELVAAGATVDLIDHTGGTPLLLASQEGHVPVMQALLEAGAEVGHADEDGATALMSAAQGGHLEACEALIARGACADEGDERGITALARAIAVRRARCVVVRRARELPETGTRCTHPSKASRNAMRRRDAPTRCTDDAPAQYAHGAQAIAAQNDHAPVIEGLLARGASLDLRDSDGWTAAMMAAWGGRNAAIRTLAAHGADLNATHTVDGRTAVMFAAAQGP